MSFEPQFGTVRYTEYGEHRKEQIKLTCRSDVASDSVIKILSITSNTYATLEKSEGNKRFDGKTLFCISYIDNEGIIKKHECGNEFAGEFANSKDLCLGCVCAKTEKAEVELSGINLVVSAIIGISADIKTEKEITYLSGGEELITNNVEREIVKTYREVSGNFSVEEEFELNYAIKEVINHKAMVIPTAVQCGVGTIIVDGEIYLSAILLQNSDKNDIIKENKVLPFRMEIEYDDAMPTFDAEADVFVKSFKTDITVEENGEKSTVMSNIVLGYVAQASVIESINVCEDVFSVTENLKCEKEKFCHLKHCGNRVERQKTVMRASLQTLSETDVIIGIYNENMQIVTLKKTEDGISVIGAFTAECIIHGENGYRTAKIETPFNINGEGFVSDGEIKASIYPTLSVAKPVSFEEIEISSECIMVFSCYEKKEICYVKSVIGEGDKKSETVGISVYIPYEGEELWSLSKRLNVCPDALVEANKDLQFPLSGKERIVVFRKK